MPKNDMKPVSVIIPTYNRSEFLKRAVHSVRSQENFKGEIIVIDDASTDSTKDTLAEIQTENMTVYRHSRQFGPATARNIGVSLARYSMIAFLDSDDHWHKTKLCKQLSAMQENPGFRISHTYEKWLRRGKHLNQKKIHRPRHGDIFDHCLQLCAVGMSTVVMEKSLFEEIGGFDTTLPCCEDYDLWLRISCRIPFLLIPETLTIKEGGRDDQISSIYRIGMDKYRIKAILNILENEPLTQKQRNLTLNALKEKCLVYGSGCHKHGKENEGDKYFRIIENYITKAAL